MESKSKILTITLNPSIDITYKLENLKINDINRIDDISKVPGGKGINVGKVSHILGNDTTLTGIIGGSNGEFIRGQLDHRKIKHDFYEVENNSRICIAIIHEKNQTELLETSERVDIKHQKKFVEKLVSILPDYEFISLSGSNINGFSDDIYKDIVNICNKYEKKIILDAGGRILKTLTDTNIFMIKPNEQELMDMTNSNVVNEKMFKHLGFKNVEWLFCTLGKNGALIRKNDKYFKATLPFIEVGSPVGSGDATVAGFMYGITNYSNATDIIKCSMAAGLANTINDETGFIEIEQFEKFFKEIKVEEF